MKNLQAWISFAKEGVEKSFILAKFLCTLHVANTYLLTPAFVWGPSMLPTFNLTGNLILAERISFNLGKIRSGDVVLVRSPENPRKVVTKRIKGMEGDEINYAVDPQNSDERKIIVV